MKYWSRGFAMATRTARDSVPFLPARPACCRVDIMVPGKPEMMTASREPISIPSSSALVETIPFISPFFS